MNNINNMQQLMGVLQFAAEKHKNQHRKDGKIPYINHPIQVANTLAQCGEDDVALLSAALLHDTIEDTQTSEKEISDLFGEEVLNIVKECTDNKKFSRDERKLRQVLESPKKSRKAKALKIADKICNIRDIAICPPSGWSVERRFEYLEWAEQVVNGIKGTNKNLENLFDQELKHSRLLLERKSSKITT